LYVSSPATWQQQQQQQQQRDEGSTNGMLGRQVEPQCMQLHAAGLRVH
jgi:hypothetical protein